ncbi:hypothetical protein SK854_38680 [Lentzea sp. BCCO 10_0061]|uniref:Uncharacterized protein n=1 Tax=Lentzea sokolovensis TaxID=3095429 RepID=A0ABU4V8G9_9PSEU|nr:hypothetical protein [Lentzea sp. BCCO 10_0061]MDX8148091.1 hypothetical protein [Lentzea sp. BCCO 10_0061]
MRITGTQGGAVARLLTERGHEVRRTTREPSHPNDVRGVFLKAEIERHLAAHHPHRTVPGPAAFMGAHGPVALPIPPD